MLKPQIHYPKGKQPSKQAAQMEEDNKVSPDILNKEKEPIVAEMFPVKVSDNLLDEEREVLAPLSAEDLHKYYSATGKIKMVSATCAANKAIQIKDASLKERDTEDEEYLNDRELVARLRRGNAVVIVNSGGQTRYSIARRGLPKFFDLRKEHLPVLKGDQKTVSLLQSGKSKYHEYKSIFAGVFTALAKGTVFNLYRSGKANGENAQISFLEVDGEGEFWVACSKNVTMLYRDEEDLQAYPDDERFSYARKIGEVWLDIYRSLPADKQQLVKEVAKKNTLVGEYCGNPLMQHLVKYDKETLVFYAVVPKDCSMVCWPNKRCFDFFKEAGLDTVHYEVVENVTSRQAMYENMTKLFEKVAGESVQDGGEGSVVYLEGTDPDTQQTEVYSMCKLKTMEYRFLRKAREKIKRYIRKKAGESKILEEYEKECISLLDDYPEEMKSSLPEVKYYKEMLATTLGIISEKKIPLKVIEKSFINVLILCQKCHDEKREPTNEEVELVLAFKATDEDCDVKMVTTDPCTDKGEVNIVVLDIPGLFDVKDSMRELQKSGYRVKFDFGEKKCFKKTLRFINITKESINIKRIKPFTYLIVPSVASLAEVDQQKLKDECQTMMAALFGDSSSMDDETDETKMVKDYLQSSVNNIGKATNIENCIDLILLKLNRVKDIEKKCILCPQKDQSWQEALLKEVAKIESFHNSKV